MDGEQEPKGTGDIHLVALITDWKGERMVGEWVLERTPRQLPWVHSWRVIPLNELENEGCVRVLQRNRTVGHIYTHLYIKYIFTNIHIYI